MNTEELAALRKPAVKGEWIVWLHFPDETGLMPPKMECHRVGGARSECVSVGAVVAWHLSSPHRDRYAWCRPGDPLLAKLVYVGAEVVLHSEGQWRPEGYRNPLESVMESWVICELKDNGWHILHTGALAQHISRSDLMYNYWAWPAEYECIQKREAPGVPYFTVTGGAEIPTGNGGSVRFHDSQSPPADLSRRIALSKTAPCRPAPVFAFDQNLPRSGRTTRMIQHAVESALSGRNVIVVFHPEPTEAMYRQVQQVISRYPGAEALGTRFRVCTERSMAIMRACGWRGVVFYDHECKAYGGEVREFL